MASDFKQLKPERVTDALWLRSMDDARAPKAQQCRRTGRWPDRLPHEADDLETSRAVLRDLAPYSHFAWELKGAGRVASDTFFFFDILGR